jgi:hypothetical protein
MLLTAQSYSAGKTAAREQRQPPEQPDHEQTSEAEEHDRRG